MDRITAHKFTRDLLKTHNLNEWGVRMDSNPDITYLGMCDYNKKLIILSGYHVDINPESKIIDTIRHEVAHALTPGNGHNSVWAAAAESLGAITTPCGINYVLPEHVKDAIRSGKQVIMEEETIKIPKFKVTQLKETCPDCGKTAKELFSIESVNDSGDTIKLITLECFHIITKIIPRGTPFEEMVSNDWKPEIKNCKHKWIKNRCDTCEEYRLFNFQVIGARKCEVGLVQQKGFGIFDDMGLGKTVQALATVKYHPELTPTLYVVKSAILYQWLKQILRWLGPDYLGQIIRTSRDPIIPGLKSYIISYDLLKRYDKTKLESIGIKLVIMDECQSIKNPDSDRTKSIRSIVNNPSIKVIGLSGTPWKNRGSEFFPILNMINPLLFHSYQHFLDTDVEFYWDKGKRKMGGIAHPDKFRVKTDGMLVRREFNEVMDEFPDINRTKLPVKLDDLSQTEYDNTTSEFVEWYNEYVINGEEDSISSLEILAKMARMRHITGLAKIPATLGYVEEFLEDSEEKLVIFVHHKDVGEILFNSVNECDKTKNPDYHELAADLLKSGVKVLRLTGTMDDADKFKTQELFNSSKRSILIASTLAAGEGIDLQTCHNSILHERQWNPQNEDQATPGRFRRIGQKSSVINITVPEAEDTIDIDLDYLVEKKRKQFHLAMNKSALPTWADKELGRELAEIIVAKHRAKNKGKVNKTNITNKAKLNINRPVVMEM